jgi:Na+-driven multidrug efflux pump
MMGNNIIRAEGKAKFAMIAMIVPAFFNIGLISFIKVMNLGMTVAACQLYPILCFICTMVLLLKVNKTKSNPFKFNSIF